VNHKFTIGFTIQAVQSRKASGSKLVQ